MENKEKSSTNFVEENTQEDEKFKSEKVCKKKIIIGIAVTSIAMAAIGGGVLAYGMRIHKTETPPEITEPQDAVEQQVPSLSEADIAARVASLSFAGNDVSYAGMVTVTVKDGHVMIVEDSQEDAFSRIRSATLRSAALASQIKGSCIYAHGDSSEVDAVDVTWVVRDGSGGVRVAVTNGVESGAAMHASSSNKNELTVSEILHACDGWVIDQESVDEAKQVDQGIEQAGGRTPVTPEGSTIEVAKPVELPDDAVAADTVQAAQATQTDIAPAERSTVQETEQASKPALEPKRTTPVYRTETWREWVEDSPAWDETVVVTPAWDQKVVAGEKIVFSDGAEFYTAEEAGAYEYQCALANKSVSYHGEPIYKTVHHEAVTKVVHHNAAGHYETRTRQVLDHYE